MRKYLASLLLICMFTTGAYAAADFGNAAIISPVDASNASGTCPSWSGSAAPSSIDDSGRCFQGAAAREWQNRSFSVTSSGSSNAYVVAYTVAPAALRSGQVYSFITNFANTDTATVNINSLGAKTIKKDVAGTLTALASGDMGSGQFVMLAYNGTDMIWVNWQGAAGYAAGGTDVAITDGGTGQSTATAAFDALGPTTTQGDIIYHNGSDNVRLATGTDGQVLTSGGAGANPAWETLPASGTTYHPADLKTSGTTYTTVATCTQLLVEVIGGGGDGSDATGGQGGGGGGYARKLYTVTPSTGYTYAVAAAGGDSTFTDGVTLITGNNGVAGGAGGTGTNGDVNISGQDGHLGDASAIGGNGGTSGFGMGMGGRGGTGAGGGQAGKTYGGGGGGEGASGSGGDGATGAVIFTPLC